MLMYVHHDVLALGCLLLYSTNAAATYTHTALLLLQCHTTLHCCYSATATAATLTHVSPLCTDTLLDV
jgi:hypothetical protein